MAVDAVMSMVGVGLGDAVVEAVLPVGQPYSLAATPWRLTHRRSQGRGRIALKSSIENGKHESPNERE